jgi:ketosteroid isomerase-like protein
MSPWTFAAGAALAAAAALGLTAVSAPAQTEGTCVPVSERAGRELGCFITADEQLGALPRSPALYWHLDTFPSWPAAEAARGPRGTVVESLGTVWLFTIAPAGWRPPAGVRVAEIGPIPIVEAESHAAVYMEGVFRPGMASVVHRHPGAEAWYTLAGSQCLETPDGVMMQRAGGPGIVVRAGPPMMLTGTGTETRRSVVLILQDASKPRSTPAHDWTPKGLCGRDLPAGAAVGGNGAPGASSGPVTVWTQPPRVRDNATVSAELTALYQRFVDATRTRDTARYRDMMTADYIYVGGDSGVILDRTQRLRRDAQDPDRFDVFRVRRCDLRVHGTAAVGPCWYTMEGVSEGQRGRWEGVSMVTFVRGADGQWRIAATRPSPSHWPPRSS